MEADHVVYVLSSSDEPDLYRYVGCTEKPIARLAMHARHSGLVSTWATWTRIGGHCIQMREVSRHVTRDEGRAAEMKWIVSLSGSHLLNRESWPVCQHNAGVPRGIVYAYRNLMRLSLNAVVRGKYNEASDFLCVSKSIASEFPSLNISRVGAVAKPAIRLCARLGVAESLPVIGELLPLESDYQGTMPCGFRAAMVAR